MFPILIRFKSHMNSQNYNILQKFLSTKYFFQISNRPCNHELRCKKKLLEISICSVKAFEQVILLPKSYLTVLQPRQYRKQFHKSLPTQRSLSEDVIFQQSAMISSTLVPSRVTSWILNAFARCVIIMAYVHIKFIFVCHLLLPVASPACSSVIAAKVAYALPQ